MRNSGINRGSNVCMMCGTILIIHLTEIYSLLISSNNNNICKHFARGSKLGSVQYYLMRIVIFWFLDKKVCLLILCHDFLDQTEWR